MLSVLPPTIKRFGGSQLLYLSPETLLVYSPRRLPFLSSAAQAADSRLFTLTKEYLRIQDLWGLASLKPVRPHSVNPGPFGRSKNGVSKRSMALV